MSTLTAEIFERVSSSAVLMVPPPNRPLEVARELAKALYTTPNGLILREHRGDLYRWNGTHWPNIDRRDVRAAAYRWLEHAWFIDADQEKQPFAPTRRKIADILDALRAVVLVDSLLEAPTWIHDTTGLAAREIIPMANGLLHVPTRTLLPRTPEFFSHHSLPFEFDIAAPPPIDGSGFSPSSGTETCHRSTRCKRCLAMCSVETPACKRFSSL
jgi:putative DNA primase/helicase